MQAVKTKAAAAGVMLRCQLPANEAVDEAGLVGATHHTTHHTTHHANNNNNASSSGDGSSSASEGAPVVEGPMDLSKALDIVSRHAKRCAVAGRHSG